MSGGVRAFVSGAPPVRYRGLNVKVEQGVSDNEITDRKNMFGINKVGVRACVRGRLCGCGRPSLSLSPEPQDPLWKLMIEAMKDPTLIFLTVAAFISLFIGVSCLRAFVL